MSYVTGFDDDKNYYVFKYVVDKMSGEPTEYEGEIMGFVKAKDPWEACEKLGFDDPNAYGANYMEDVEGMEKAISDERKHLTKISKQLKEMRKEIDAEREEFMKDRPCPNGCGKMDEKFRCGKCGFGFEQEKLLEDLEKTIEEVKANGEDASQLEAVRDKIKEDLEEQED